MPANAESALAHNAEVAPQVYDELEELTGFDRTSIQTFKSVAENTSLSRNKDLSFNHHKAVAPLEPEQQKEFSATGNGGFFVSYPQGFDFKKSEFQALSLQIVCK